MKQSYNDFLKKHTSSSVQLLSRVLLFVTPWTAALQASLSITNSQSLLKFMSISLWCYLTISSSAAFLILPLIFPSIRVFSNELGLHIKWSKYWRFNISPFNEYSELTSFSIDWFDFLAVQGTLKSRLSQGKCCQLFHVYFFHINILYMCFSHKADHKIYKYIVSYCEIIENIYIDLCSSSSTELLNPKW